MAGRRLALLVAVDQYEDERLPGLAAPARDARALAGVLGDGSLGGFDVEVLHNATSLMVSERLDEVLTESRRGDVVLLHFGCHGLRDDYGDLYLAASNTQHQRLISTGVNTEMLLRMMRRSRASSVVLLLDCCYGGAFAAGVLPRAGTDLDLPARMQHGPLAGGTGRAVITASGALEWAFEVDGSGQRGEPSSSVFTRAIIEGIGSGEADRDQDGRVSLDELYSYVDGRVRASQPGQHPAKFDFGIQGDLYIARSPRRLVAVGELPSITRELIASPSVGARLGAVHDLALLAAGDVLPRAAAAIAALRELSDDDSRTVSGAAADALTRIGISVSRETVDLGLVHMRSAGAPSPAAVEVRLSGVPLALASAVRADPGISAWIDGDRLMVMAAPTAAGAIEGVVTVAGPAGEAIVPVTGWAAPDPRPLLHDAVWQAGTIVGNPAADALVRLISAWVASQIGDQQLAMSLLDHTPELLRAIGHPALRAASHAAHAWVLGQIGDRDQAQHELARARALITGSADDTTKRALVLLTDWVGATDRDQGLATLILPAARELALRVTAHDARALCLAGLAWIASCLSEDEIARSLLAEAEGAIPAGGEGNSDQSPVDRDYALLAIAWVWNQIGDSPRTLHVLAEVQQLAAAKNGIDGAILSVLASWVTVRAGQPEQGRQVLAEAEAIARGTENVEERAFGLLLVALVAAWTVTPERAQAAAAEIEAIGAKADTKANGVLAAFAKAAAAIAAVAMDQRERAESLQAEAVTLATGIANPDDSSYALFAVILGWTQGGPGQVGVDAVAAFLGAIFADEEAPWLKYVSLGVIACAGIWAGIGDSTLRLLTEIDAVADEAGTVALAVAAWAAIQVGDWERATRLISSAAALARDGDEDPTVRAATLAALGWVSQVGDSGPPEPVVHLLRLLYQARESKARNNMALREAWAELLRRVLLLGPGPDIRDHQAR